MSAALTDGIELAVGACCLVAGVPTLRRSGLRWLGLLLLAAGAAACAHALARLLS
jgi:hypothetical protein